MPVWLVPGLVGFALGAAGGTVAGVNLSGAVKLAAAAGAVAWVWNRAR